MKTAGISIETPKVIPGTAGLMTRDEAGKFLRLSPATLANWSCTGKQKVPTIKLGKRCFYRQDQLEKWLESRAINQIF